METCFSSHKKATEALRAAVEAKKDDTNHQDLSKAAAKYKDNAKASDEQQSVVEVDYDGFKIRQGAAHCNWKKLETAEHQKIVDRVLKRDLDPSDNLVDVPMN